MLLVVRSLLTVLAHPAISQTRMHPKEKNKWESEKLDQSLINHGFKKLRALKLNQIDREVDGAACIVLQDFHLGIINGLIALIANSDKCTEFHHCYIFLIFSKKSTFPSFSSRQLQFLDRCFTFLNVLKIQWAFAIGWIQNQG
jgi:hypothetical protein